MQIGQDEDVVTITMIGTDKVDRLSDIRTEIANGIDIMIGTGATDIGTMTTDVIGRRAAQAGTTIAVVLPEKTIGIGTEVADVIVTMTIMNPLGIGSAARRRGEIEMTNVAAMIRAAPMLHPNPFAG